MVWMVLLSAVKGFTTTDHQPWPRAIQVVHGKEGRAFPFLAYTFQVAPCERQTLRVIRAGVRESCPTGSIHTSHRGMPDQPARWDLKHQRANMTGPRV
jgi:hypothetical protein